jgi:hypothetical protein
VIMTPGFYRRRGVSADTGQLNGDHRGAKCRYTSYHEMTLRLPEPERASRPDGSVGFQAEVLLLFGGGEFW